MTPHEASAFWLGGVSFVRLSWTEVEIETRATGRVVVAVDASDRTADADLAIAVERILLRAAEVERERRDLASLYLPPGGR